MTTLHPTGPSQTNKQHKLCSNPVKVTMLAPCYITLNLNSDKTVQYPFCIKEAPDSFARKVGSASQLERHSPNA
jgi:hypothetical protein